jgi:hypothetical protein
MYYIKYNVLKFIYFNQTHPRIKFYLVMCLNRINLINNLPISFNYFKNFIIYFEKLSYSLFLKHNETNVLQLLLINLNNSIYFYYLVIQRICCIYLEIINQSYQ